MDLERAAGTEGRNVILEPSVGVVLVAHSMGGFVAADALFSVLSNRPELEEREGEGEEGGGQPMFPQIHGLLAFDTPFNGLARSMFAYGAFSQYQNISGIWSILSTVSSSLPVLGASAASASTAATTSSAGASVGAGSAVAAASQARSWRRWQALAARTGTVGAIMAGGVAAYVHREKIYSYIQSSQISMPTLHGTKSSLSHLSLPTISGTRSTLSGLGREVGQINYRENLSQGLTYVSKDAIGEGFAWMASHLKFVGQLMKTAQLTHRLERLHSLRGIGVSNLYTSLGENDVMRGGYFVPQRTFCAVPTSSTFASEKDGGGDVWWHEIANTLAANEIEAHCSMFRPDKNSGYDVLLTTSAQTIAQWARRDPLRTPVIDDYTPSREVLHRSRSEHQLWDDDGKVLKPAIEGGVGVGVGEDEDEDEDEDDKQLHTIVASTDLDGLGAETGEGQENDEIALKAALEVPLPVDEEGVPVSEDGRGGPGLPTAGELGDAMVVPLPEDEGIGGLEEEDKGEESKKEGGGSWGFKNPLQGVTMPSVGNPLNYIYRGKKADPDREDLKVEEKKEEEEVTQKVS